jgi:hypothetical protein
MDTNSFIAAKETEKIYMNTIYPLTIEAALKEVSRRFSKNGESIHEILIHDSNSR